MLIFYMTTVVIKILLRLTLYTLKNYLVNWKNTWKRVIGTR